MLLASSFKAHSSNSMNKIPEMSINGLQFSTQNFDVCMLIELIAFSLWLRQFVAVASAAIALTTLLRLQCCLCFGFFPVIPDEVPNCWCIIGIFIFLIVLRSYRHKNAHSSPVGPLQSTEKTKSTNQPYNEIVL